jgi:hypothetical protein
MRTLLIVGMAILGFALFTEPATADVSVNINVGPPPVIFSAPPRVVVIPRTPVAYAPDTSYNVFVYGGRYFSFHDGAWFLAASHGGPWTLVPAEHVPRPLLAVPVKYYKIPPGHMKKHRHHHGHDRDHHHGRGGKHRDHCPPGHAKQGRC